MALEQKTIWFAYPSRTTVVPAYWDTVFVFDDSLTTYTDETTDAANLTASDVTYVGDLNDILYFGMTNHQTDGIHIANGTNPAGGTRTWEYWNGTTWAALSPTAVNGNVNLTATQNVLKWTPPTDWATTAVNAVTRYWIRARVTGAYTTAGIGSYAMPAVVQDFGTKTIYIPETTNRTIRSVGIIFSHHLGMDADCHIRRVHIKLGSAAFSYVLDLASSTAIQTTSAEQQSNIFTVDATSYFQSNFGSGASEVLTVRISESHIAVPLAQQGPYDNYSVSLFITYDCEEQETRIKTVIIPLQGNLTVLPTTLTELGTNQVPNLSTFLPEDSKVYRDIFFEIRGNCTSAATTDYQLGVSLDAEAEHLFCLMKNAQNSSTFDRYLWSRNDMTTNATHAFKMRTTSASQDYVWCSILLHVTYEYNHTNSTTIMNSIQKPAIDRAGYLPSNNVETDKDLDDFEIWIQEPTTITVRQSALLFSLFEAATAGDILIKVGSAAGYTTYTALVGTLECGQKCLCHRIDSDITLARGRNVINAHIYSSAALNGTYPGYSAMLYLNYTSGKHSGGDNKHNRTTYWIMANYVGASAPTVLGVSAAFAPSIPETNYWVEAFYWISAIGAAAFNMALYTEVKSGEGLADGWRKLSCKLAETDSESGYQDVFVNESKPQFKRFPNDPDSNRLDVETARIYRIHNPGALHIAGWLMMVLDHHITYTISGTVSGYTGDGSGIIVDIFRVDNDEKIGQATTAIGGGYSFTWYDNTIETYAVARQDNTKTGRSADGVAS